MITLQLSLHSNLRGRGLWKLKTSFLKDEEYANQIRAVITRNKDEYSQDNTVTPGLLWEMIKMKTREASINYGKSKKRNIIQKKDDIEKSIKILEEQVANTSAMVMVFIYRIFYMYIIKCGLHLTTQPMNHEIAQRPDQHTGNSTPYSLR